MNGIPRTWRIVREVSRSPKGYYRLALVWMVDTDTGELHLVCIQVG